MAAGEDSQNFFFEKTFETIFCENSDVCANKLGDKKLRGGGRICPLAMLGLIRYDIKTFLIVNKQNFVLEKFRSFKGRFI